MKTVYRNSLVLTFGAPTIGAVEARGLAAGVIMEVGRAGRASTGEVVVYNLSDTTRAALAEAGAWVSATCLRDSVASELLTQGDIASVRSEISGRDMITTLAVDTGRRGLGVRVSLSYPPGARLRNVVGQLAQGAGLSLAYFDERLERASMGAGWAYMGSVGDALRDACASSGAIWRIVGGGLYVEAERAQETAVARRFAPGTGLIGSPVVGDDGVVDVLVELETGIVPGSYFELSSRLLSGAYRAREVTHEASTVGGGAWTTTIKGVTA